MLEGEEYPRRAWEIIFAGNAPKRKSMDQPFSIMGFMQRRIGDKRCRLYSESFSQQ
jgi:hypothetical protein